MESNRSLTRRSDFFAIKEQGIKKSISGWLLIVSIKNKNLGFRHAWIIPGHQANSVVRNKLKRRGRESIRRFLKKRGRDLSKNHGFNIDVLFIFRNSKQQELEKLSSRDFELSFQHAFSYLEKKYDFFSTPVSG